jgi:hypothetical protein
VSVKLTIEITGPLDEEDRDLLSGVAVMTLAIANHEMAKAHFPGTFNDDDGLEPTGKEEEAKEEQPVPCAYLDPERPDMICVGNLGHRGRHKFRQIGSGDEAVAVLAN